MANRLITQENSDVSNLASVGGSFFIKPKTRLLEVSPTLPKTKIYLTAREFPIKIGDKWCLLDTPQDLDIRAILDTGTISPGQNYYFYICNNNGDLVYKISLNSTYPTGYTADTSYKLGGFHTLCYPVGTYAYSWHPLYGYTDGNILPASIWDLRHRPISEPAGMVYIDRLNLWCDIYLSSGATGYFVSIFNLWPTYDTMWVEVMFWGHPPTKKRLATDSEFATICLGSPIGEVEIIVPNPTTGGNIANMIGQTPYFQRALSAYGVEDTTAVYNQWLKGDIFYDGYINFETEESIYNHTYGSNFACKNINSQVDQISCKLASFEGSAELRAGPFARFLWPSFNVPPGGYICTRGVSGPSI